MEPNPSIVKIGVRKHWVTIENELHVKITHSEDCQTNCLENGAIIDYLQAELFLKDGFIVTNEGEL